MVTKKSTSIKKTDGTSEDSEQASKKKDAASSASSKSKKPSAARAKKKADELREQEVYEKKAALLKPFITPPPVVKAPVVPPPTPVAPTKTPFDTPAIEPKVTSTPAPFSVPKTVGSVSKLAAQAAPAPAPTHAPVQPQKKKSDVKPVEINLTKITPVSPKPNVFEKKFPAPMPARHDKKPAPKHSSSKPTAAPAPSPAPVKETVFNSAAAASSERKKIRYNEMMTVKDLADAMEAKVPDVIRKLLTLGTPASINQRLDAEITALVADGFGFDIEVKSIYKEEVENEVEAPETLKSRPAVVTVMGHVDHGKTSLLDAIRSTRVVDREAGGITQHIGAYQVKTSKGVITFLDTPGHEAFTAMRARGAMATDLVILVVAADDSVMPQTIEAIDHAKAAKVPIVVAINKIDLPTANSQKVKQELATHELVAEDWGGKTIMVEVSAKANKNIDKLLEMIALEAELLELKANPDRAARGVVLEARLDPKRGITATLLVQTGTMKVGDVIVCGLSYGRIKATLNDVRQPIEIAGPSMPVEVLGLNTVPQVGDQFSVVGSEREAREIAERRRLMVKESPQGKTGHLSLESLHSKIEEGKIQDLPVILKADMQGSLQAIQDSLGKLASTSIQLRFVHTGIGNINESDVLLAEASDAIVFGFHVKVDGSAEAEAKKGGVDIRTYQIIYEMLADVRAAMEGLLKPEEREVVKGKALVKSTFSSSRYGMIAGCMVTEGKISRNHKARVLRGTEEVFVGTISSLRRFKDDVKEVDRGFECGLSVEGFKTFQSGDLVETFVIEKHARRLEA